MIGHPLARLRRRFEYRADRWPSARVLPDHGPFVYGDCDDFAVTLAYDMAGRSSLRFLLDLILFRSVIWFVLTDDGTPHAALWRRGSGWADNIAPHWSKRCAHRRMMPILWPIVLMMMLLEVPAAVVNKLASR